MTDKWHNVLAKILLNNVELIEPELPLYCQTQRFDRIQSCRDCHEE